MKFSLVNFNRFKMSSRRVTEWKKDPEELNPKPGDLIEIDKIIYRHWVLYLSNNKIIYFEPSQTTVMVLQLKFDELVPAVIKTSRLKEEIGLSFV